MPKHRKPPKERFLPQGTPAAAEESCSLHSQPHASDTSATEIQEQHVNDIAGMQQTANQELQPLPSDGTEMSRDQMSNLPSPSATAETEVPTTDDSQLVACPLSATHVELSEEKCSNRSCAEVNKQLQDMKAKYAKLREDHSKASAKTNSIKKKLQKLEYASGILRKKLKFLNEDQMRALSRNSNRGTTWSSKTIKQALQIKFASGTTGYETLRKLGYPLPSNRTLVRRLQGLKFLPGILTEVTELLRAKAEGLEDVERDCVLYLDEMEIARGYELDRAEDVVFGGKTLPAEPDEPACHCLVFMVGGLNSRWKQVIAYHFTGSSVDGCLLKNFVLEIVQLCADISLRVLVVTSDMGASNRAMWREFGFSSHRNSNTVCAIPHPVLEGKELFFTADAAHVIKNIRGQLLNSVDFTLSDATVCHHGLPSNKVKLEHVRAVVEYDSDKELEIAPKLSEVHISKGHYTKMKVGIAVQFFKESPAAIRCLIREKVLEPEAETTAWFLDLIAKWYKLMSSRHPSVALSCRDMAKYHEALETLRLTLETIQGMQMGSTSQWKPSQAGLMVATTVVLRLQNILLKSDGYKFLLTGRLLQDCLENLFSVVRQRKPVPNAYDMKCALKLVCVSQFLHTPANSSYENDDSEYLVDMISQGKRECRGDDEEEIDDGEILFIEALTSIECSILHHIGGFLVKRILKKTDCKQCRAAMQGSASHEHAYLTALKEYVQDGENLCYPSGEVMSSLISCEEHFKGITSWTDNLFTLKSPLKAVTEYLIKRTKCSVQACQQHKGSLEKMLISSYARVRLRIHLRQLETARTSGSGSKTCAAVNLQ